MSLKGIISISGMPGLYKVLAQTKSGFIVESLADKKRMPVSSTQRISMLDDISVFTNADDLPLKEVMLKLIEHAEKNQLVDAKSDPAHLRKFFETVVPEYDAERVYPSDIKKIINWFYLVKDFVAVEDEPEGKHEDEKAETGEQIKSAAEGKQKKGKVTDQQKSDAEEQKKSAAPKKKATTASKADKADETDAAAAKPKPKKKTASK